MADILTRILCTYSYVCVYTVQGGRGVSLVKTKNKMSIYIQFLNWIITSYSCASQNGDWWLEPIGISSEEFSCYSQTWINNYSTKITSLWYVLIEFFYFCRIARGFGKLVMKIKIDIYYFIKVCSLDKFSLSRFYFRRFTRT